MIINIKEMLKLTHKSGFDKYHVCLPVNNNNFHTQGVPSSNTNLG